MTQRDHDGRRRSGVWLPDECWDWLDSTSQRDGTSRSDLVEGLILLAMDDEDARATSCACEHHDDGSCVAAGDLLNAEHVIHHQRGQLDRLRGLVDFADAFYDHCFPNDPFMRGAVHAEWDAFLRRHDHCRPDEGYHSTPHKGCVLR